MKQIILAVLPRLGDNNMLLLSYARFAAAERFRRTGVVPILKLSLVTLVLFATCCQQLGGNGDCEEHWLSFKSLLPVAQGVVSSRDANARLVGAIHVASLSDCANPELGYVLFVFSTKRDGQCYDYLVETSSGKRPLILEENTHTCGPGDKFKEYPIDIQEWSIDSVQALERAQKEGGTEFVAAHREAEKLGVVVQLERDPSLQRNVWSLLYTDSEGEELLIKLDATTGEPLEHTP
jgi:hypothetical protein